MKNIARAAIFLAFLNVGFSAGSHAEESHGTVVRYHLNAQILGRGPCVQLDPPIQSRSGWACLWVDNALYDEMEGLLLEAFSRRAHCTIHWHPESDQGEAIDLLECWLGYRR